MDYVSKKRKQRELRAKMSELQKKQLDATMPDSVKYADGGDVNLSEAELNRFGGEITQEEMNRAQQAVANRQLEVAKPEIQGYGDDPYLNKGMQDTILEFDESRDRNNVITPEKEGFGDFSYADRETQEQELNAQQNKYAEGGLPETNRFQDMLAQYRGLRDPEKEAQMQEQIRQDETTGGIGKFASRLSAAFVPGQKATAASDFENYSADSKAKLKEMQGQPDKDMAGVLRMAQMNKALAPVAKKPTDFTLSEGQKRYDATGKIIASGPEKKTKDDKGFTLGEGQIRYDKDGKEIARGLKKQIKPEKYKTSNDLSSKASKKAQDLAIKMGILRNVNITDEKIRLLNETQIDDINKAAYKKINSKMDEDKFEQKQKEASLVEDRHWSSKRTKDEKAVRDVQGILSGDTGARSTVAKSILRESIARDGLRVIESIKKGKFIPTEQVAEELATVLASTLMGGNSPTREAIVGLIPHTAKGSVSSMVQYVASEPKRFITPEFIDHFEEQIKGQQKFWGDELTNKEKQVKKRLEIIFNRKRDGKYVNRDLLENYEQGIDIIQKIRNVDDTESVGPYGDEVPRNGKIYKWNPVKGKYQIKGNI